MEPNNFTFNFPDGSSVNRTLPVVLNNIDTYYSAYKWNASVRLDGIFLDEAATWVRAYSCLPAQRLYSEHVLWFLTSAGFSCVKFSLVKKLAFLITSDSVAFHTTVNF